MKSLKELKKLRQHILMENLLLLVSAFTAARDAAARSSESLPRPWGTSSGPRSSSAAPGAGARGATTSAGVPSRAPRAPAAGGGPRRQACAQRYPPHGRSLQGTRPPVHRAGGPSRPQSWGGYLTWPWCSARVALMFVGHNRGSYHREENVSSVSRPFWQRKFVVKALNATCCRREF